MFVFFMHQCVGLALIVKKLNFREEKSGHGQGHH